MSAENYIENKINTYAKKIINGDTNIDEHALGEISFYMMLRRVISGQGTRQDIGMLDAINDTLQSKGLIEKRKTFLSCL